MVRHRKRDPRRHQRTLIEWFQNADSNQRLIHHIPHEIIQEILLRMPVKSLLKFKCVSKSWRFLISSPDFIKTHLQNSSKNATYTHHRVLSTNRNRNRYARHVESFSLNSFLYNPVVDSMSLPWDLLNVVDSCNGLFCVISSNYHVFLWNPTTRKYRVLPDSMDHFHCFNSFAYGIGFDESNYDYKIVKITPLCLLAYWDHFSLSDSWRAKVYSLKTDSWKRIEDFPGQPTSWSSKFSNGKIHWPSYHSSHPSRMEIVSLDMKTEAYEIIQLPFPHSGYIDLSLGLLGGCLSMLVTPYGEDSKNLWILKEYGVNESWTNVINIPSIYPPYSQVPSSPLYMLNDGQILLLFGSTFVLYNPEDQSWRTRVVSNSSTYYGADVYVESLVSPYAEDGPRG